MINSATASKSSRCASAEVYIFPIILLQIYLANMLEHLRHIVSWDSYVLLINNCRYKDYELREYLSVASFLDPRFKSMAHLDPANQKLVVTATIDLVMSCNSTSTYEASSSTDDSATVETVSYPE